MYSLEGIDLFCCFWILQFKLWNTAAASLPPTDDGITCWAHSSACHFRRNVQEEPLTGLGRSKVYINASSVIILVELTEDRIILGCVGSSLVMLELCCHSGQSQKNVELGCLLIVWKMPTCLQILASYQANGKTIEKVWAEKDHLQTKSCSFYFEGRQPWFLVCGFYQLLEE